MKKNKMRFVGSPMYMAICIALLLILSLTLLSDYFQKRAAQRQMEQVSTEVEVVQETETDPADVADEEEEEPEVGPALEIAVDFDALHEVNQDIFSWVFVPGTSINYPVLQSPEELDTDYYLNTNLDGTAGYPGCIYIQKRNQKDYSDPLTVLYGHNMKNGTMFATLHSYEEETFFQENPYIYISTEEETIVYRIFAAVWYDNRLILDYYKDFTEEGSLTEFLDSLSNYPGNFNEDITVDEQSDTVIGLSTCVSQRPNERFYVFGKKLSEDEVREIPEEEIQKVKDMASGDSEEVEP